MAANDEYVLELLVNSGLITSEDALTANASAGNGHGPVDYLVQNGLVTREDILRTLSSDCGMDFSPKIDPIPEETLKKIVDAGIHAPSGGNLQDWAFVLIRDAELKRFIRDQYWGMWQKLQGSRGVPTNLPPARMRMYQAVAHLAEYLHEVPVMLLSIGPERAGNWAQKPRRPIAEVLDLV